MIIWGSAQVVKADNFSGVSRSGLNLLSRGNKVSRSIKDFLGERVVNYWNNLPA